MKIGDKIEFILFSELVKGTLLQKNSDKTLMIEYEGARYPSVKTFTKKTLPAKSKDRPFWYILKN